MLFISCHPRQLGFIAALLLREYQCNLCLLMDSAYGWGGGAIPFFHCVHQNKIRNAWKKCLESAKGGELTLGSSCIFLFMVTYEHLWGWGNLQSILLVKPSWRKKKKISIICSKFLQCNGESWKTSENIDICIPARAQKSRGRRLSKLFWEVAKIRETGQNLVERETWWFWRSFST